MPPPWFAFFCLWYVNSNLKSRLECTVLILKFKYFTERIFRKWFLQCAIDWLTDLNQHHLPKIRYFDLLCFPRSRTKKGNTRPMIRIVITTNQSRSNDVKSSKNDEWPSNTSWKGQKSFPDRSHPERLEIKISYKRAILFLLVLPN